MRVKDSRSLETRENLSAHRPARKLAKISVKDRAEMKILVGFTKRRASQGGSAPARLRLRALDANTT